MTQNEPGRRPCRRRPGRPATRRWTRPCDKLADLAELPLNEHPAVFEQIHGALTGALGTLDSGTGGPDTGGPDTGGPAGHPGSGS